MATKISSRKAKGRKLQQLVAEKLSALLGIKHGKDELIESREMGQSGTDVKLIGKAQWKFPFAIECKAQERFSLYDAIKQAQQNKKENLDWLVVHRKNYSDPIVVLDLDVFLKIYGKMITEKR